MQCSQCSAGRLPCSVHHPRHAIAHSVCHATHAPPSRARGCACPQVATKERAVDKFKAQAAAITERDESLSRANSQLERLGAALAEAEAAAVHAGAPLIRTHARTVLESQWACSVAGARRSARLPCVCVVAAGRGAGGGR